MDVHKHAPCHTENEHQSLWLQENRELLAKLQSQEAEACTLSLQVSGIREELVRRDGAQHAERLAREATIQQLCVERNSLAASLAAAQAEVLAVGRCNTELEARASRVEQVASTLPPALKTRSCPGGSMMLVSTRVMQPLLGPAVRTVYTCFRSRIWLQHCCQL